MARLPPLGAGVAAAPAPAAAPARRAWQDQGWALLDRPGGAVRRGQAGAALRACGTDDDMRGIALIQLNTRYDDDEGDDGGPVEVYMTQGRHAGSLGEIHPHGRELNSRGVPTGRWRVALADGKLILTQSENVLRRRECAAWPPSEEDLQHCHSSSDEDEGLSSEEKVREKGASRFVATTVESGRGSKDSGDDDEDGDGELDPRRTTATAAC
eukprot:gene23546-41260_t